MNVSVGAVAYPTPGSVIVIPVSLAFLLLNVASKSAAVTGSPPVIRIVGAKL